MNRPRAADDFATIRARIEELRRERDGAEANDNDKEVQRAPPMPRGAGIGWQPSQTSSGPGRVYRSG